MTPKEFKEKWQATITDTNGTQPIKEWVLDYREMLVSIQSIISNSNRLCHERINDLINYLNEQG